jgi:hypothetical protein
MPVLLDTPQLRLYSRSLDSLARVFTVLATNLLDIPESNDRNMLPR